jgi:putative DNA primase/helicase
MDYGIWRRIKLIPFTTRIEEEKQDKHLEEKLRAEANGILNWLLEGAMRWKREGLRAPGSTIRIWELFKAYQDWCEENNEHTVSEMFFGLHLKEMGIEQCRASEARFWSGLALRA